MLLFKLRISSNFETVYCSRNHWSDGGRQPSHWFSYAFAKTGGTFYSQKYLSKNSKALASSSFAVIAKSNYKKTIYKSGVYFPETFITPSTRFSSSFFRYYFNPYSYYAVKKYFYNSWAWNDSKMHLVSTILVSLILFLFFFYPWERRKFSLSVI